MVNGISIRTESTGDRAGSTRSRSVSSVSSPVIQARVESQTRGPAARNGFRVGWSKRAWVSTMSAAATMLRSSTWSPIRTATRGCSPERANTP